MSNRERGRKASRPGCAPASTVPHSPLPTPRSRPRGITLIELLITMVIIAIISAAILGTAAAAMESARRSRTRSTISKINNLLMERWDSYGTRRVDLNRNITDAIEQLYRTNMISSGVRGMMLADARLLALRELMKYEMPDRWSDVVNQATTSQVSVLNPPTVLAAVPAAARTYFRRLQLAESTTGNDMDIVNGNQSAECLYLTIMYATGEGEARTMFSSQDIGDTDEDGAPEFLDGWGHPIHYIRWPAGFSPLPQPANVPQYAALSQLMTGDSEADHDPFDVARRDSPTVTTPAVNLYPPGPFYSLVQEMRARNAQVNNGQKQFGAFRLVPLIYSAGADEDPGLYVASRVPITDPYQNYTGADSSSVDAQLGSPLSRELTGANYEGDTWKDNIHNHLNEY